MATAKRKRARELMETDAIGEVLHAIAHEEEAVAKVLRAESEKANWLVEAARGENGIRLSESEFAAINLLTRETVGELARMELALRNQTWTALAMKFQECKAFAGR